MTSSCKLVCEVYFESVSSTNFNWSDKKVSLAVKVRKTFNNGDKSLLVHYIESAVSDNRIKVDYKASNC